MKRLNREQLLNRVKLIKGALNRKGSYYDLEQGKVYIAKMFNPGFRKVSYTLDGYGYISLNNKVEKRHYNIYIHHIVLILHNEEEYINRMSEGMTVNHISGDKEDNSLANLEYLTQHENTFQAYALGLGMNKPLETVINEYEAYEMLEQFHSGKVSVMDLAEQFNLPLKSVKRIVKGKVYSGLFVMYRNLNTISKPTRKKASKLTVTKVRGILKEALLEGKKQEEIAKKYKVSRSSIGMVVSGARWKDVYEEFIKENSRKIADRA